MSRCPACPIADPATPCPSADWPAYCGWAAKEAATPGRRHWTDRLLAEAKLPPRPGPAPPPPGFPARSPSGVVRFGVLSPSCYLGGADLWVADLMAGVDPARARCVGAAIGHGHLIEPGVRAAWEAMAPAAVGPDAIRALAAGVDVLVAWGVGHSWGFPAAELRPLIGDTPLVVVSHGSEAATLVPGDLGPHARGAAVSPAAVRGLPEPLREGARVVLNRIDPARVVAHRSRAEVRAASHVPEGAKVVGWLGRFASEKRPEVFVRALALLPGGYFGVAAGIGYGLERAMGLAREVCPGRIQFLGGRHDVGDVLATCDVLAMPSATEACSLAAGEAWLAGVPLVSTPVGLLEGHPDLARLVPNPPTPGDLAAAILADFADPEGTAARVAGARTFAREQLSPGRFGRDWTDLICATAPKPEPPGLMAKAANLARSVAAHVADGGRQASPEAQAARRASCFSCEVYHDHGRDTCRQCGCSNMDLKRSWSSSRCPLDPPRWDAE